MVIGSPALVPADPGRQSMAAGRAIDVAHGATDAGSEVQLVGRIGDDPAGDALLLALAEAGVGHVAVLRDPARRTPVVPPAMAEPEALLLDDDLFQPAPSSASTDRQVADPPVPTIDGGDLDLALRYLPDHRVVVVAEGLEPDALAVVAADCSYVGAVLVVIVEPGAESPGLPQDATAFEAPAADPDGLFGRTIGRFAAALDKGTPGPEALAQATAGAGWQSISG